MIRKYINGTAKVLLSCIIAASMVGCTVQEHVKETYDVFKAENSSGYAFEMHTNEEGKVIKVVENGEEYDEESLAAVQTVVDDLGLNVFYEAQSYAVSAEEQATITYNDTAYSEARKELFEDYLSVSKCSKSDGDLVYSFEFETEEDQIVGMTMNFLYKGDFTMFKGNEELIGSVIDYVKVLIAASVDGLELSSEDAEFEILDEGMNFSIRLSEEDLTGKDTDLITTIISLTQENQGFVCH